MRGSAYEVLYYHVFFAFVLCLSLSYCLALNLFDAKVVAYEAIYCLGGSLLQVLFLLRCFRLDSLSFSHK